MGKKIITDKNNIFSYENIYNAYYYCRKNKRNTINAIKFEINLLENLYNLQRELEQRSYCPSRSICFIHKRPKLREVFAADFRDRIIHHLLVGYLEPVFERIFIYDSYSCRVNKGIHAGVKRLKLFLNKVTANGTIRAWYLKEDIKGFFMNIDKKILYELIKKKIKRDEILWLAKIIIFHDCTKNYIFKGDRKLLEKIPPHKTLFKTSSLKGLPIGNLTSQFFANVYLNELDQFIKRKLKCRYYLRYCDDFLLLSQDKEELTDWHLKIKDFLEHNLLLELKSPKIAQVSSGIDFLGYIVRRKYILVRRRSVNHLKEKIKLMEKLCAIKKDNKVIAWKYNDKNIEKLRGILSSYFGHFSWANSFNLINSIYKNNSIIRAYFLLDKNTKKLKLRAFEIKRQNLRKKWKDIKEKFRYKELIITIFKIGKFYEIYNEDAIIVSEKTGLKLIKGFRGFKYGCGFYKKHLGKYLKLIKGKGLNVLIVNKNKPIIMYRRSAL